MNDLILINQFAYIIIFFLGLILGSFLNSWVWRTHEKIKIGKTRSMCLVCRRQLAWYENIPVFSYLFLLGKCRTCKTLIPKHFIFVELSTALIFLLVAWHSLGSLTISPVVFFRDIFFSALLIVVFLYDWLYEEILPEVIWLGALGGLFFNIYLHISLLSMLIGFLLAGGFFLAQFLFSQGQWIGGGDVRLGFMLGVWLGWPAVLLALFLSYISGAVFGLLLIAAGKKKLGSAIPFGTFLSASAFFVLLWGSQIINWYMGFLR
ncbi:MAG TPA: prepilin peptidase [Candidatus Udaeobacter sp.]|nr:prepilin peptidase [Candidatus Udaeobacter sp.]